MEVKEKAHITHVWKQSLQVMKNLAALRKWDTRSKPPNPVFLNLLLLQLPCTDCNMTLSICISQEAACSFQYRDQNPSVFQYDGCEVVDCNFCGFGCAIL